MAATPEEASLASQCLDLCQMLDGSLFFTFSLTVGNNFSFSLEMDTRERGALSSPTKKKKKSTPSTVRRNARRREDFLRKKLAAAAELLKKNLKLLERPWLCSIITPHPLQLQKGGRWSLLGGSFSQLDGATPAARKEMTSRVLPQAEVGDRPSCDPWDLYILRVDLSSLLFEGKWHWCLPAVHPWDWLHMVEWQRECH